MKTCCKCKETKSLSEFYKSKDKQDGLQGYCKDCSNKSNKKWREENKQEKLDYQKNWREDNPEYTKTPKAKYSRYKSKAKNRGYEFNLTLEEFTSISNQDCYYCGKEGFGIDRFDNSTGYTSDNCVPCCTMCNKIKSNHDYDDLMEHIELMLLKDSNIKGVF